MQGARFGNYEVISQLGAGGMGTVYVARHTLLGRSAAVKVLRPELSQNREMVNRFFNEARAATSIQHPGIIEIFDFGYDDANCAYIIMELLQGESLGHRLHREGRISLSRALTMVRQIAGALQAAHEQQILHRDLKPDNVFLVLDPEIPGGERIKLLDFGIAKLLAEPSGEGGSNTVTGVLIGTPTYMSPEQCRGSGTARLDGRSDLYALGCIFYELLSGRPPFVTDGVGDLMAHHMYFPPPPLSTLLPAIPASVESLVLRLLSKDPQERPPSAAVLVAELDALGPLHPNNELLDAVATPATRFGFAAPTTLRGSTGARSASSSSDGSSSRRRRRSWLLLTAAIPFAAVAGWIGLRAPARTPVIAPVSSAPAPAPALSAPAPTPTPLAPVAMDPSRISAPAATAPAEAPVRTVLLQFLVRPESAQYQLSMDGKKLLEPQIEVPMSRDQKVELEVVAKGYLPYRAKLLPTSDQVLTIELQRGPGRRAPASPLPRPSRRVDRVEDL
jgi:serine/threonine protein kinase